MQGRATGAPGRTSSASPRFHQGWTESLAVSAQSEGCPADSPEGDSKEAPLRSWTRALLLSLSRRLSAPPRGVSAQRLHCWEISGRGTMRLRVCEEEAAPQAHGDEGRSLRKIAVLVCMHSIVWDLVSSPQDWKRDPLLCRCSLREGSVPSCIFQCHPKDSGEDTPSSIPFKVPVAGPASRSAFDATGRE